MHMDLVHFFFPLSRIVSALVFFRTNVSKSANRLAICFVAFCILHSGPNKWEERPNCFYCISFYRSKLFFIESLSIRKSINANITITLRHKLMTTVRVLTNLNFWFSQESTQLIWDCLQQIQANDDFCAYSHNYAD